MIMFLSQAQRLFLKIIQQRKKFQRKLGRRLNWAQEKQNLFLKETHCSANGTSHTNILQYLPIAIVASCLDVCFYGQGRYLEAESSLSFYLFITQTAVSDLLPPRQAFYNIQPCKYCAYIRKLFTFAQ